MTKITELSGLSALAAVAVAWPLRRTFKIAKSYLVNETNP